MILFQNDKCPHCEHGVLMLIKCHSPYEDHLQCDCCDSTFILDEQIY
jgi:hypothetical protein